MWKKFAASTTVGLAFGTFVWFLSYTGLIIVGSLAGGSPPEPYELEIQAIVPGLIIAGLITAIFYALLGGRVPQWATRSLEFKGLSRLQSKPHRLTQAELDEWQEQKSGKRPLVE